MLRHSGDYELQYLPQEKLLSLFKRHKLSSHDLKLLLRCCSPGRVKHPAILPRPANQCVIFLVEHVKMICFTDQCIILTPDDMKTDRFVESLKKHDRFIMKEQDFEHIVLENASSFNYQFVCAPCISASTVPVLNAMSKSSTTLNRSQFTSH